MPSRTHSVHLTESFPHARHQSTVVISLIWTRSLVRQVVTLFSSSRLSMISDLSMSSAMHFQRKLRIRFRVDVVVVDDVVCDTCKWMLESHLCTVVVKHSRESNDFRSNRRLSHLCRSLDRSVDSVSFFSLNWTSLDLRNSFDEFLFSSAHFRLPWSMLTRLMCPSKNSAKARKKMFITMTTMMIAYYYSVLIVSSIIATSAHGRSRYSCCLHPTLLFRVWEPIDWPYRQWKSVCFRLEFCVCHKCPNSEIILLSGANYFVNITFRCCFSSHF